MIVKIGLGYLVGRMMYNLLENVVYYFVEEYQYNK